jgi:hypothetical protein
MSPLSEIYTLEYSPESSPFLGRPLTGLVDSDFILVLNSGVGVYPLVVKERVRNGMKRNEIRAFLLERNGTATVSVGSDPSRKTLWVKGYTPPMKMDCYQNKGVARRAFCKRLKRNGMDDGK